VRFATDAAEDDAETQRREGHTNGLHLTCRYPGTALAHENIAGYTATPAAVLRAVARQGSYSFAGHRATQPTIA
jgi:hypothetical protein